MLTCILFITFQCYSGLVGITVVILTFLFLREDIESASTATKKNTSWKSIATSSVLWGIAFAYLCTLEVLLSCLKRVNLYSDEDCFRVLDDSLCV